HGTVGLVTALSGTVTPGFNVPAILQAAGGLSFGSNGTYLVHFLGGLPGPPDFDQLRVNGPVQIDNNSSLQISLGFTPAFGSTYRIIDNDGSDSVNGTFAALAEGALITSGSVTFQITYQGGSGNDVVLTRVHPPSSVSSIVCDTNGFKQIQGIGDAGFA